MTLHCDGERWHSGRAPYPCVLCLPQTYLRLWVQFLSSPFVLGNCIKRLAY